MLMSEAILPLCGCACRRQNGRRRTHRQLPTAMDEIDLLEGIACFETATPHLAGDVGGPTGAAAPPRSRAMSVCSVGCGFQDPCLRTSICFVAATQNGKSLWPSTTKGRCSAKARSQPLVAALPARGQQHANPIQPTSPIIDLPFSLEFSSRSTEDGVGTPEQFPRNPSNGAQRVLPTPSSYQSRAAVSLLHRAPEPFGGATTLFFSAHHFFWQFHSKDGLWSEVGRQPHSVRPTLLISHNNSMEARYANAGFRALLSTANLGWPGACKTRSAGPCRRLGVSARRGRSRAHPHQYVMSLPKDRTAVPPLTQLVASDVLSNFYGPMLPSWLKFFPLLVK